MSNTLTKKLVDYCDAFLREKKQHMAMRGAVYSSDWADGKVQNRMCILKSYAALGTGDETKYVWEMHATERDGKVTFSVEGPYEDSDDEYWLDMYKHDKEVGNGLITPDYMHYTVSKDSRNPGQGDGHSGREFKLEIDYATASRLSKMGLNVVFIGDLESGKHRLHTRNLWQQGRIPKKHREHFQPNCKIL